MSASTIESMIYWFVKFCDLTDPNELHMRLEQNLYYPLLKSFIKRARQKLMSPDTRIFSIRHF